MDQTNFGVIKVLVVDDDETLQKIMAKFFVIIGCTGSFAKNGNEAIELVRKNKFDLCFMDLFMPEMGGIEAAQIIQEEIDPKLPIIALTSHALQASKDKCLEVGMMDYLSKPVTMETIKKTICKYGVRGRD